MKQKLILDENFDNVQVDLQAVAPPVFVQANEEHDHNKEKFEKAMEANEEAIKEITAENKEVKPVKSKVLKQMHLSESLFDEAISARPNHDKLLDLLFDDVIDHKFIAKNLMRWLPDDELGEFIKYYGLDTEEFDEALDDNKEQFDRSDFENFESELYKAIVKVCNKYELKGLSKQDIEKAIDFFFTTAKDAGDIDIMDDNIDEALEDDYNDYKADIDTKLADMKAEYLAKGISEEDFDAMVDLFSAIIFADKNASDIECSADDEAEDLDTQVEESIKLEIAKEQLERFNEGKMPENWNPNLFIENLVKDNHISEAEAELLKESIN